MKMNIIYFPSIPFPWIKSKKVVNNLPELNHKLVWKDKTTIIADVFFSLIFQLA